MHVELVVPSLLLGRSPGRRLPALEMILARAQRRREGSLPLEAWLMEAFSLPGPCPAGALTRLVHGGDAAEGCWLRADPVHLLQRREMLVLAPPPAITVREDEARAFAESINAHFGDEFFVHADEPTRWSARLSQEGLLEALPPLEAAGRNVNAVLPGGDAKRWHALANELQMLLHAHPANAAREARRERPVNSLWLWGAGKLPAFPASRWQTVWADDPLARGIGRAAGARDEPLARHVPEWLGRLPADGRHLALLDALRAPQAFDDTAEWTKEIARLEDEWFAPLLGALREGRIDMLTLHVPDGADRTSHELVPGDLRRFWKRPKPIETL